MKYFTLLKPTNQPSFNSGSPLLYGYQTDISLQLTADAYMVGSSPPNLVAKNKIQGFQISNCRQNC